MKQLFLTAIIISVFFAGAGAMVNPNLPLELINPNWVNITAPDDGDNIDGNETYRITWADSGASFAAVSYSKGGKWFTLYSCNKNAHRYDWSVPAEAMDTTIRVEVFSNCGSGALASGTVDIEIDWEEPVQPCTCDSCSSCSDMLEGSCETVYLGRDIIGGSSQCVQFNKNDKTFDCQGNSINGYGMGQEFYYGIFTGSDNVLIKNCVIEGFEVGIDLHKANGADVVNNTLNENYGSGVFIADSDNVYLEGNSIENGQTGVSLADTQNTRFEDNRICGHSQVDIYSSPWATESGSTLNDDVCDTIFNWNGDNDGTWCEETCNEGAATSVGSLGGLQDALSGAYGNVTLTGDITAPGGVSFNTSHVTLICNGHSIRGSGSGTGVAVRNKLNVELRDCVIEDFATGVLFDGVSHSRILENTISDNEYGLIMRALELPSRTNTIDGNTVKPNEIYGIYLDGDVWDNTFTGNDLKGGQYSLYTTAKCDNDIDETNTGGHSAQKIGYFHDQGGLNVGTKDYSELVVCNVENSLFDGISVTNGASQCDGAIIRDSEDVELRNGVFMSDYNGVVVLNSTGVKIRANDISNNKKDCVVVEKSTGTEVASGVLTGCDRGVFITLSTGTKVSRVYTFSGNRIAAVQTYMASSSEISNNTIMKGTSPADADGIILAESSDNSRIIGNSISGLRTGISMDATSNGNRLETNTICGNNNDILNTGSSGNTGNDNTCDRYGSWSDDGTRGCENCCSVPSDDIDKDGIDNSCDCADLYMGRGEMGMDCGGKCSDCVECTWCDSTIKPLRIKGQPNDGYIDVVFVARDDWTDWNAFERNVSDAIRDKFLNLNRTATQPIFTGYEDMFNFYIYEGGRGQAESADLCYIPEYTDRWICASCPGWLPGEHNYMAWAWSCGLICGLTLGLGCGCYADEPDHFWNHASFADAAAMISQGSWRGCSSPFGPPSQFIADTCGFNDSNGNVIIHEFAHSVFSLTDEYCGDTSYSRASQLQNVWTSASSCRSTASSEGWVDGECRQIEEDGCSKDKYRWDSDNGTWDLMNVQCGNGWDPTARFKEADVRRINYVFDNWPGGGSKGVMNYMQIMEGKMTPIISRVVPNHPDLMLLASDFTAVTQSAGGEEVDRFSFSDPRVSSAEEGTNFVENTAFHQIVPMHGNVRWLHIFNGTSGEEMIVVDMGPAIWNYCNGTGWAEEDCKIVDLNNNGVLDYQEDWSLDEAIDALNETAPGAEAPVVEREPEAVTLPEALEQQPPAEQTKPGQPVEKQGEADLTGWIIVLTAIVILLFAVMVAKGRKKSKASGLKSGGGQNTCKNCGTPIEKGHDFCPNCGAKQ